MEEAWKSNTYNKELLDQIEACEKEAELLQLATAFVQSFMGGLVASDQVDTVEMLVAGVLDLNDFAEKKPSAPIL